MPQRPVLRRKTEIIPELVPAVGSPPHWPSWFLSLNDQLVKEWAKSYLQRGKQSPGWGARGNAPPSKGSAGVPRGVLGGTDGEENIIEEKDCKRRRGVPGPQSV